MAINSNFNVPFIPQENITQQILSSIQMANDQHAQQQVAAARQKQLQIAQQEADTASQHLAQQAPLITAETNAHNASTALTQEQLETTRRTRGFLLGNEDSPDVDPAHVEQLTSQIAGPHTQPGAPQPAQAAPAQPQITPPSDGSSPAVAPAAPAKPARGFDAYLQGLDKKVGLLPEEKDAIGAAKQIAAAQGTPAALAELQKQVEGIVAKRNDPTYARYVALRQQGLSANDAHQKIASIDAYNAALTKLATDPAELTGDKAVAAVEQLKGMLRDPSLDPGQKPRVQGLLTTAKLAVSSASAFDAAKKKADKAAQDGDPEAAGHLLAQGLVAPNEITTGRNSAFAVKAFQAAVKEKPDFKPQVAQAEFDVAKSPTNVGFFGSAKSLTDKGGTLDQLTAIGKKLDNGNYPAINSIENAAKLANGNDAQAHYAATLLGVSDDLAKVLGGTGGSTDSSRAEAKALVISALNTKQRAGALQGIRDAVNSQKESRIGNNSVLRTMYGDKDSESGSGAAKVYHYDAQGNLVQ